MNIIKFLVEKGADANAPNESGDFPLYRAVRLENMNITKFLVEKGANVNVPYSLLHESVRLGNMAMSKFLTEKGANVNTPSTSGNFPLHEAVRQENMDIIKFLIEKGASANNSDGEYRTPLHYALVHNNVGIARLLIKNGADINSNLRKSGQTPLEYALANEEVARDTVSFLSDLRAVDNQGQTLLTHALKNNYHYVLKYRDEDIPELLKICTNLLHNASEDDISCTKTLRKAFPTNAKIEDFIGKIFVKVILVGRVAGLYSKVVNIEVKNLKTRCMSNYIVSTGAVKKLTGQDTNPEKGDTNLSGFQLPVDEDRFFYAVDFIRIDNLSEDKMRSLSSLPPSVKLDRKQLMGVMLGHMYTLHSISSLVDVNSNTGTSTYYDAPQYGSYDYISPNGERISGNYDPDSSTEYRSYHGPDPSIGRTLSPGQKLLEEVIGRPHRPQQTRRDVTTTVTTYQTQSVSPKETTRTFSWGENGTVKVFFHPISLFTIHGTKDYEVTNNEKFKSSLDRLDAAEREKVNNLMSKNFLDYNEEIYEEFIQKANLNGCLFQD